MEQNLDYETFGYYEPGFLHLRLNSEQDLSKLGETIISNPALFSTFIHEYVHFLQNITTTTGLYQSIFYIQMLKDIVWQINNTEDDTKFNIPFKIDNRFNGLSKIELHNAYTGDVFFLENAIYKYYDEEFIEINDKDNKSITVSKFKVTYVDCHNYNYKNFYFGSYCIKEYVAHSIQNSFLETAHADIPYTIAESILYTEVPNLKKDYLLVVALCDATLMTLHPAQCFFRTIARLKDEVQLPTTTIDIYNYTLGSIILEGEFGNFGIESLYEKLYNDVIYEYGDALKSDYFSKNLNWVISIIKVSKELRFNGMDFMTNLVRDKKVTEFYYSLIKIIGSPFLTNNKFEGNLIPPINDQLIPDQPYLLLVFSSFIKIIGGNVSCQMYEFCKNSPKQNFTNHHCKITPWLKVNEKELCPLAQIWKTWGLQDKIPNTGVFNK